MARPPIITPEAVDFAADLIKTRPDLAPIDIRRELGERFGGQNRTHKTIIREALKKLGFASFSEANTAALAGPEPPPAEDPKPNRTRTRRQVSRPGKNNAPAGPPPPPPPPPSLDNEDKELGDHTRAVEENLRALMRIRNNPRCNPQVQVRAIAEYNKALDLKAAFTQKKETPEQTGKRVAAALERLLGLDGQGAP